MATTISDTTGGKALNGNGLLTFWSSIKTIIQGWISPKQDHNIGSANASKAIVTDSSGNIVAHASTTASEIGYLHGTTSEVLERNDILTAQTDTGSSTTGKIYSADAVNSMVAGAVPTATQTTKGGIKTTTTAVADGGAAANYGQTAMYGEFLYVAPVSTTSGSEHAGVMSVADKQKLDGIASGATNVTVDSALSASSENPVQNMVINTALNGKQATITGGATTITSSNLTASRALISNASGKVAVSDVTSTELGYLDGVTSNVQTQLNNRVQTANVLDSETATGSGTTGKIYSADAVNAIVSAHEYELDAATTSTLGGVKVSSSTSITGGSDSQNYGQILIATNDQIFVEAATTSRVGATYAPVASVESTNTTKPVTGAAVASYVSGAISGATSFQGVVNANTTISSSDYKSGWYWIVGTAGTYVGQECEVGDQIYATANKGSGYSADDFSVVQTNVEWLDATDIAEIIAAAA